MMQAPSPPGLCMKDVRAFLGAAGGPSDRIEALLQGHGLSADASDEDIAPADLCWRVFSEHASLVHDETHAVFSEKLRPGATGLIIARMMLCQTLGQALEAYADASSLMIPGLIVSASRRSNGMALRWRTAEAASELHHVVLEGTAAVFYAIFSWITGAPPLVLRVRAPAARRESRSTLLNLMQARVIHGGDDLEVLFDGDALEAAVRAVDVGAWRDGAHRELARLTIEAGAAGDRGGLFTDKVRAALLDGADQQGVARRWGVSPKTVTRRLEQEGWSFRRLRDEARMQRSTSLIHAGMTVEEIGEAVGYEDSRSFRRAFRRWFGVSPSVYRSQHAVC